MASIPSMRPNKAKEPFDLRGRLERAFVDLELADKKKQIYDGDIEASLSKEILQVPKAYQMKSLSSTAATALLPQRSQDGNHRKGGQRRRPHRCIPYGKIVGKKLRLEDYQLHSVTEGMDALGDALVKISSNGKTYAGRGLSTDVIEASIHAYINAVNKMIYEENKTNGV